MEDQKKLEIIDIWMNTWLQKKCPKEIKSYSDWRRFLEYWLEREKLDFNEVWHLWQIKQNNG